MRRLFSIFVILCSVSLPLSSAFAEGNLTLQCEVKETEAQRKLCWQNKKQEKADQLKQLKGNIRVLKRRMDRLQKKRLSKLSKKLREMKEKLKDVNPQEAEKMRRELDKLTEENRRLENKVRELKKKREKSLQTIREELNQLKETDQNHAEAMSDIVTEMGKTKRRISQLKSELKQLSKTATAAKNRGKKLEQELDKLESRVSDLEESQVRLLAGAESLSFAGGPGFTGLMANTGLSKPFADSRFYVSAEFGLGGGFSAGKFRPAVKTETGLHMRILPEVSSSLSVGYSQGGALVEDETEFRYIFVASEASYKFEDYLFGFVGGNVGAVYHTKGEKPDFGRGMQLGVRFQF